MNEGPATGSAVTRGMLLGEDHPALGEIAVVEPRPHVALALSAGRLAKLHPSVDPNEDALMAASDGVATMLAVADGHHGFSAARACIVGLHDGAPALLAEGARPRKAVGEALRVAVGAVRDARSGMQGRTSRTALTVAVASADEVAVGTIGDTTAVLIDQRGTRVLGRSTPFLGPETDPRVGKVKRARLAPDAAVVVMSDGAFGFLGRTWPQRVAEAIWRLDAPAAADAVVRVAHAAGAGDHVAVAVLRRAPRQ